LKFGIVVAPLGQYCDRDFMVNTTLEAERLGFDSILLWDHFMYSESNEIFEAFSLLSFLASRTSTIRLGTCVTPLPFRPPGLLAKVVSTLDVLSQGRIILGVGAGWYQPEFEAYSQWDDSSTRVAKTKEALELLIKLWTEEKVDYAGKYYSLKSASLEPKPIQKPHPPLWFGTRGRRMARLTAKYGNGWLPRSGGLLGVMTTEEYARGMKNIQECARKMGRHDKFTFAVDIDPPDNTRKAIDLVALYEAGGSDYCAVTWRYPCEDAIPRIKWWAKEVVPSFS
jgi:probable F420-dependent oxidoreductase